MKLAEALLRRKQLQEKLNSLDGLISDNLVLNAGDIIPDEDPLELYDSFLEASNQFRHLVVAINRANNEERLLGDPAAPTIMEAISMRDEHDVIIRSLNRHLGTLSRNPTGYDADGKRVKLVQNWTPRAIRDQIGYYAGARRELDSRLQQTNWTVEIDRYL